MNSLKDLFSSEPHYRVSGKELVCMLFVLNSSCFVKLKIHFPAVIWLYTAFFVLIQFIVQNYIHSSNVLFCLGHGDLAVDIHRKDLRKVLPTFLH